MFTLDAFMKAAPMSVGAQAMETKLQCLRNFHWQIKNLQHISNALRNLGPAPAAAPAAAPTSSGTLIAKALNAVRTAPASPLDETIPHRVSADCVCKQIKNQIRIL